MERSAYCHNRDSQISAHLIHHIRHLLVQVFLFTEKDNYIHVSGAKKKKNISNTAEKSFSTGTAQCDEIWMLILISMS